MIAFGCRLTLVLALSGGVAHAQSAGLTFEELVIEGEVQKPEITVVISRENLNKAYLIELKESFLHKILESVRKPPF
jgi:hypothetical protein